MSRSQNMPELKQNKIQPCTYYVPTMERMHMNCVRSSFCKLVNHADKEVILT